MISDQLPFRGLAVAGEIAEPNWDHAQADHAQADRERVLEQELFRIGQEYRKVRYRQWKFEQTAIHKLFLLGQPKPLRVVESYDSSPHAPQILGHLDTWQLVRDNTGRYHFYVKGWAWSLSSRVIAIDLFLGESRWVQFDYGDPRVDVRQHFSGSPEMEYCGFSECLALPENFHLGMPCALQVCDLDGHWKRFESCPEMKSNEATPIQSAIQRWARFVRESREKWQAAQLARQATCLAKRRFAASSNIFSLLLTIDDSSTKSLIRCVESVRRQIYGDWELLLTPTTPQANATTTQLLNRFGRDNRITSVPATAEGRAAAINAALERTRGRHIGFLDANLQLTPDALLWAALAIELKPNTAWLYADGMVVDPAGQAIESDFKPDFSEPHLWARFFTRGFSLYRREAMQHAGNLRPEFDDAAEYDLALRLARQLPADQIYHLPEPVFLRSRDRQESQETAAMQLEDRRRAAELLAVSAALHTADIAGTATAHACGRGVHRLEFAPRKTPRVVIVIPTRDKAALVRRCVESLRYATRYPNYQVLVINNESTEPALFDFFAENRHRRDFASVDYAKPFNHSAMHNEVLADVDGEFAVLLNNDVCDFSAGWLEQLVAVMELDPHIAGVGPLLVYPDQRVQHGGVILGLGGGAAHAHLDVPSHLPGYQGRLHCVQDLSACTAACLLIRLSAFHQVGGFRAQEYPVGFNDVDLWLRLRDAGYRCVYQPAVTAMHYESVSRGVTAADMAAIDHLKRTLAERRFRDPFYSPHLSQACERFRDLLPYSAARRAQWERLVDQLRDTT